MKQSEYKKKLEKEQERKLEESNKFWADFNKKPKVYKNMVCKNIKYSFGGHDGNVFGMCWHCDKCGRSGVNYEKNSIRKIDSFIEEKCNLEEG